MTELTWATLFEGIGQGSLRSPLNPPGLRIRIAITVSRDAAAEEPMNMRIVEEMMAIAAEDPNGPSPADVLAAAAVLQAQELGEPMPNPLGIATARKATTKPPETNP